MWLYLSGSDQSPTAKSIPIVREFSCLEYPNLPSITPQSGMTSEPLILHRGYPMISTSSTEAFHAKISALQDMEKAWKESEADYIGNSIAWSKKFVPDLCSSKTYLAYLYGVELRLLTRLPKWGMIRGGVAYQLRPLAHYIKEKGGSCLPTPAARDWKDSGNEPSAQARKSPNLPAFLQMLPTPQACDANKGPAKEYIPNGKQSSMRNLVTLAARLSTTGKILNPQFVEWLMGYPIGHTELEDWVMQWFLSRRKKRSKS